MFAERFEALFALHRRDQAHLAAADPGLRVPLAEIARHRRGRENHQQDQDRRSAPDRPGGERDRAVVVVLAHGELRALVAFHVGDERADLIHRGLAAVAAHDFERARRVAGASHRHRLAELRELRLSQPLERLDVRLLLRVGREPLQRRDFGRDVGLGERERLGISFVAREQVAALRGLGVLQTREDAFELLDRFECGRDAIDCRLARLQRPVRQERDDRHGDDADDETDQC